MDELFHVIFLIVSAIVIFSGGAVVGYTAGYKQGQIDYSNGIKKYCLTVQSDSSKIWELCNEK